MSIPRAIQDQPPPAPEKTANLGFEFEELALERPTPEIVNIAMVYPNLVGTA
jgi:hypothetical protein